MSNRLLITIFFPNVDICIEPPDEPALTAISSRYPKLTLILEEIDIYFVHRVVSMANPFAKRLADVKKYAVVFVVKMLVDVKKQLVAWKLNIIYPTIALHGVRYWAAKRRR